MRSLSFAFAAVLAVTPLASISAQCYSAANLVTNCGFEYDGEAGWTLSGNTGYNGLAGGHLSATSWNDGAVGSLAYLSQTLVTSPGGLYDFSFWYASKGLSPNEIFASFDGVTVLDAFNTPALGWQQFAFSVTASSSSTTITLGIRSDPSSDFLDDVVVSSAVTATPEPASILLMGTGLFGLAAVARRRKRD